MKKLFYLTNLCNLLLGILLFISTYFVYGVNFNIIVLFIGVFIFEVTMFINYYFRERKVVLLDYIINSCYFIFVIFYLIFILYYQHNNTGSLNMVYFSKILFIPHFLYAIFIGF